MGGKQCGRGGAGTAPLSVFKAEREAKGDL